MSQPAPTRLAVPIDEQDQRKGPLTAKASLVEYGDYESPASAAAHQIVKTVAERLGDRVCYAFRPFPMSHAHPDAERAAEVAEAAAAQGKFWEMHEQLFSEHEGLDPLHLERYAAALGIDADRLHQALTKHVYARRVREQFMSGVHSGVHEVPAFFVNGERYTGPLDVDSLAAALETAAQG
ncbi:MAG: thioredoxin domain-containing protein [Chloroflexi bacterium]|nr:thioredoxin domain-containing protein [Chloroflexota bacterium]